MSSSSFILGTAFSTLGCLVLLLGSTFAPSSISPSKGQLPVVSTPSSFLAGILMALLVATGAAVVVVLAVLVVAVVVVVDGGAFDTAFLLPTVKRQTSNLQ